MKTLTIKTGRDAQGRRERVESVELHRGQLYAIVGNTGAGKSRLIADIEQMVQGDTPTERRILIDGIPPVSLDETQTTPPVAHLSQSMRFVLDVDVRSFLELHASCRGARRAPEHVIDVANSITPEHIDAHQAVNRLSGGQTRALMIADVACICKSPIVLIDEIENAGIDKARALDLLCDRGKLVLAATHDPHTALRANKRIVMEHGGVVAVVERQASELAVLEELDCAYRRTQALQARLRMGALLI